METILFEAEIILARKIDDAINKERFLLGSPLAEARIILERAQARGNLYKDELKEIRKCLMAACANLGDIFSSEEEIQKLLLEK